MLYETDTDLKISGIRHIVAVSGLHVSVLYGLISMLTLRKRFLTAFLGIPVIILFAAIAGFTPSVTRACIMICLMMVASLLNREYDAPSALAFSFLLMLLQNPFSITSVSLQLSVACVAGILLFQPPIYGWMKAHLPKRKKLWNKLQSGICSCVSVTLGAMSLVTPVSAWYFGAVSLVGVLTNLLTIWAVGIVFYGLVAVCLVYFVVPAGATVLALLLSWLIRYILHVADIMASLPMAAIYMDSIYVVIWLIFMYILLAAFLVLRKKQPGRMVCCGLLGLSFSLLLSWAEPMLYDTQITMLDVGQGQSILLQSAGKTWLVDCGGDDDADTADIIAERLLSQGIGRIDGIILTHYDRDHAGALHNLLTRVDTDMLILPDTRNDFILDDYDGQFLWVWNDMEISTGASKLHIFGPVYSGFDNENSLCVLFDTENCDILITGDRSSFGERMLMRNADLPDVDVLVAGHHGAEDATSEALLQKVKPEIVLISVAEDNYYGHPAAELLQRLEKFDCSVYRTDHNGTITIRR